MAIDRKTNVFEKILIAAEFIVVILGYFLIDGLIRKQGFSISIANIIFLWLILIALMIIAAVAENMKEELKLVVSNQAREMRLLRDDLRRKR